MHLNNSQGMAYPMWSSYQSNQNTATMVRKHHLMNCQIVKAWYCSSAMDQYCGSEWIHPIFHSFLLASAVLCAGTTPHPWVFLCVFVLIINVLIHYCVCIFILWGLSTLFGVKKQVPIRQIINFDKTILVLCMCVWCLCMCACVRFE